jgi:Hemerythrin HHE cation binding domain
MAFIGFTHPALQLFHFGDVPVLMSTSAKTSPHDALTFLAANHKALLAMLRDYERHKANASAIEKGKAALRLCHCLSIHCAIKEEIFHPATVAVLGKKAGAMLAEARVQMGVLRGLMATIEGTSATDAAFDPMVKVLGDDARRHFETEENELFPLLRHAGFDRAGTGERLATRQSELSTAPPGKAVFREARHVLGG